LEDDHELQIGKVIAGDFCGLFNSTSEKAEENNEKVVGNPPDKDPRIRRLTATIIV
jgi:hypothetical protein